MRICTRVCSSWSVVLTGLWFVLGFNLVGVGLWWVCISVDLRDKGLGGTGAGVIGIRRWGSRKRDQETESGNYGGFAFQWRLGVGLLG